VQGLHLVLRALDLILYEGRTKKVEGEVERRNIIKSERSGCGWRLSRNIISNFLFGCGWE
jgi:hypothetical protein